MLKDFANNCNNHALKKQKTEAYIVLERGLATIPLTGIDVPVTSGLASCPSMHVSLVSLFALAQSK
jgi:hypothetical protein